MKQYRRYSAQGVINLLNNNTLLCGNSTRRNRSRKAAFKPLSIWGWFKKYDYWYRTYQPVTVRELVL